MRAYSAEMMRIRTPVRWEVADEDHAAPAETRVVVRRFLCPSEIRMERRTCLPVPAEGSPASSARRAARTPGLPDGKGAALAVEHPVRGVVEHRKELPPDRPEGRVDRGPSLEA